MARDWQCESRLDGLSVGFWGTDAVTGPPRKAFLPNVARDARGGGFAAIRSRLPYVDIPRGTLFGLEFSSTLAGWGCLASVGRRWRSPVES